ncbi:agd31B [Symbiodinium natans]|uniref:Agd31B protein n=1 Tax=Symbiodinium natans TaxID=878477 RepID=A0A812PQV3_9DINO|nr:agd31B [Symbiodinium natans]
MNYRVAQWWGWKDRAYIEDTMQRFRDGFFPIDAVIIDFEWFTNETDYDYPPDTGKSYYEDFGFNEVLFPEPQYQLSDYNDRFHIKVAGIRKPRIGNTATIADARKKGWLLKNCEPGGGYPPIAPGYACGRGLNYSLPEVRDWYADQLQPLLDAGMAFWWNDEGESDYFTFHYWNEAQRQALQKWQLSERFFSVNRAFSPGMARLGATVWTGDVFANWATLEGTPGTMLKWILAGAPYVSCDSGGDTLAVGSVAAAAGNANGSRLMLALQLACAVFPAIRFWACLAYNAQDESAAVCTVIRVLAAHNQDAS